MPPLTSKLSLGMASMHFTMSSWASANLCLSLALNGCVFSKRSISISHARIWPSVPEEKSSLEALSQHNSICCSLVLTAPIKTGVAIGRLRSLKYSDISNARMCISVLVVNSVLYIDTYTASKAAPELPRKAVVVSSWCCNDNLPVSKDISYSLSDCLPPSHVNVKSSSGMKRSMETYPPWWKWSLKAAFSL